MVTWPCGQGNAADPGRRLVGQRQGGTGRQRQQRCGFQESEYVMWAPGGWTKGVCRLNAAERDTGSTGVTNALQLTAQLRRANSQAAAAPRLTKNRAPPTSTSTAPKKRFWLLHARAHRGKSAASTRPGRRSRASRCVSMATMVTPRISQLRQQRRVLRNELGQHRDHEDDALRVGRVGQEAGQHALAERRMAARPRGARAGGRSRRARATAPRPGRSGTARRPS